MLGKKRLECDKYKGGYAKINVAAFMLPTFEAIRDEIRAAGALFISAGSLRSIYTKVKKRADGSVKPPVSLHMCGLAIDLSPKAIMQDPLTDPYVAISEGQRKWRVYGRAAADGPGVRCLTLQGIDYRKGALDTVEVTDNFIDISEVFAKHGFVGISARRSFSNPKTRKYMSSEVWHFEQRQSLQTGVTSYGDALRLIYSEKRLRSAPLAPYLDYTFRGGNFRA